MLLRPRTQRRAGSLRPHRGCSERQLDQRDNRESHANFRLGGYLPSALKIPVCARRTRYVQRTPLGVTPAISTIPRKRLLLEIETGPQPWRARSAAPTRLKSPSGCVFSRTRSAHRTRVRTSLVSSAAAAVAFDAVEVQAENVEAAAMAASTPVKERSFLCEKLMSRKVTGSLELVHQSRAILSALRLHRPWEQAA